VAGQAKADASSVGGQYHQYAARND
jgi:hypothetical protein